MDEPPLRFAAGADAVAAVEGKAHELLDQADAHRELSSDLTTTSLTTRAPLTWSRPGSRHSKTAYEQNQRIVTASATGLAPAACPRPAALRTPSADVHPTSAHSSSSPATSSQLTATPSPRLPDSRPQAVGTAITITAGDTVITATLNDSQVAQDFAQTLPATLPWFRNASIEYITELTAPLTETGPFYTDVQPGDIVYYNPLDSITIIYEETSSVPTLTKMGEITSDLTSSKTSPTTSTCASNSPDLAEVIGTPAHFLLESLGALWTNSPTLPTTWAAHSRLSSSDSVVAHASPGADPAGPPRPPGQDHAPGTSESADVTVAVNTTMTIAGPLQSWVQTTLVNHCYRRRSTLPSVCRKCWKVYRMQLGSVPHEADPRAVTLSATDPTGLPSRTGHRPPRTVLRWFRSLRPGRRTSPT